MCCRNQVGITLKNRIFYTSKRTSYFFQHVFIFPTKDFYFYFFKKILKKINKRFLFFFLFDTLSTDVYDIFQERINVLNKSTRRTSQHVEQINTSNKSTCFSVQMMWETLTYFFETQVLLSEARSYLQAR